MKENKLVELSMDFSVDVINLVKFLNSKLHSKKQVKRVIGLSFCTGQVISTSQLSKYYPQNVLL